MDISSVDTINVLQRVWEMHFRSELMLRIKHKVVYGVENPLPEALALDVSLVEWLTTWLRTSRLGFGSRSQKSGDMYSLDSIKILIPWTVTPSLVEAFHAAFYSLYPHQS